MITLQPNEEQRQILASVEDFLASRLPVDRLRDRTRPAGEAERNAWSQIADLGWFAFALTEEQGGLGLSVAEQALVYRELGRHVVSPSVFATSIAAEAAAIAGNSELAAGFAEGKRRCAMGIPFAGASVGASVAGEWQVVDPDGAASVLVWNDAGVAVVEASSLADARSVQPIDQAVAMQHGRFAATAEAFVPAAKAALRLKIEVLLAAQLSGAADAAARLAADYARIREQFGKPIGVFQGIAHACADMTMRAEVAWAQTKFAAIAVRDGRADAAMQVASAVLMAAEAALENGARGIRVHGGIGFTADCDAHHFLKRAVLLRQAAGGVRTHQTRMLEATPAF